MIEQSTPVNTWKPAIPEAVKRIDRFAPDRQSIPDALTGTTPEAVALLSQDWMTSGDKVVIRGAIESELHDLNALLAARFAEQTLGSHGVGRFNYDMAIGTNSSFIPDLGQATPATPSAREVMADFERLRSNLDLRASDMAAILGVSVRHYYSLRDVDSLQIAQIEKVRDRTSILSALAWEDRTGTAALVRNEPELALPLIAGGNLAGLRNILRGRRRRAYELATTNIPIEFEPAVAEAIRQAVNDEGVQVALNVLARIGAPIDALASQRVMAFGEMIANLSARNGEGIIEEAWEFVSPMTGTDADAFRERAEAFIASDAFGPTSWREFVDTESERAWALVDDEPLPLITDSYPREEDDDDTVRWTPDYAKFGVTLRYFERPR
jgi:hypothetical protein